jgi:hypothetical protein
LTPARKPGTTITSFAPAQSEKLTKEIVDMSTSIPIDVPDALIASQLKHGGAHGRA